MATQATSCSGIDRSCPPVKTALCAIGAQSDVDVQTAFERVPRRRFADPVDAPYTDPTPTSYPPAAPFPTPSPGGGGGGSGGTVVGGAFKNFQFTCSPSGEDLAVSKNSSGLITSIVIAAINRIRSITLCESLFLRRTTESFNRVELGIFGMAIIGGQINLQAFPTNSAGKVEIEPLLLPVGKTAKFREFTVCDSGVVKKVMMLATEAYVPTP